MKKYLLTLFFLVAGILIVNAETYNYSGTIGQSQVKVNLSTKLGSRGMSTTDIWDYVTGKYTYVKAGNSHNLKGRCYYGMALSTDLKETSPKGKKTGEWYLEGVPGDDELTGEYTNISNGKTVKIRLRLR